MDYVSEEVGRLFCDENIIVAVDSKEEAMEFLNHCEEYRGAPSRTWSINGNNTFYAYGRAYRYGQIGDHPRKGFTETYKEGIRPGGRYEGYRLVNYRDLLEEIEGEDVKCDVQSFLASVIGEM